MLVVTKAATSRALLSLAELQAAAGTSATSDTAALTALGLQISDTISTLCGVISDGVAIPTLLSEEMTETVRFTYPVKRVVLARRFVTSIKSVVVNGQVVSSSLYEVDNPTGVLRHLSTDGTTFIDWPVGKTVVQYVAGFASAPDGLKLAASQLVRQVWLVSQRDPSLKSETFDGLGSFYYNDIGLLSKNEWSPAIRDMLGPYLSAGV